MDTFHDTVAIIEYYHLLVHLDNIWNIPTMKSTETSVHIQLKLSILFLNLINFWTPSSVNSLQGNQLIESILPHGIQLLTNCYKNIQNCYNNQQFQLQYHNTIQQLLLRNIFYMLYYYLIQNHHFHYQELQTIKQMNIFSHNNSSSEAIEIMLLMLFDDRISKSNHILYIVYDFMVILRSHCSLLSIYQQLIPVANMITPISTDALSKDDVIMILLVIGKLPTLKTREDHQLKQLTNCDCETDYQPSESHKIASDHLPSSVEAFDHPLDRNEIIQKSPLIGYDMIPPSTMPVETLQIKSNSTQSNNRDDLPSDKNNGKLQTNIQNIFKKQNVSRKTSKKKKTNNKRSFSTMNSGESNMPTRSSSKTNMSKTSVSKAKTISSNSVSTTNATITTTSFTSESVTLSESTPTQVDIWGGDDINKKFGSKFLGF
jgi:hypothetical protein